jgi:hypothetical protein
VANSETQSPRHAPRRDPMTKQRPGPGWRQGPDRQWYPPEGASRSGKTREENTDNGSRKENTGNSWPMELMKTLQELMKTIRTLVMKKAFWGVTIVIIVVIGATQHHSSPTPPSPFPSDLLSSANMEQAAGGSWQSIAATPSSLAFSCFPLPVSPSKSEAVGLSEALGAKLYEVVDSFPTAADASQAYTSFTSTTDNCSWQNTTKEGNTSQFTAVADSNAPNLDAASSLWDIEGSDMSLDDSPSHDGAICAVRSGNLDAFAFIVVDASNSPSLKIIENNIEPALAGKL